jgi:GNAT superfamily N-acetyltransferase
MVERTTAADNLRAFALTRVPDEPRWIDTRGMLLSGRASVVAPSAAPGTMPGAIVVVADSALASIIDRPEPHAIGNVVASLPGDVNVLAQMENADYVSRALPTWKRHRAIIHVLRGAPAWQPTSDLNTRVFTRASAPRFDHVPASLSRELLDALNGRTISRFVPGVVPPVAARTSHVTVPMAAAWADGRPVSFCYPVWQTETLWDVSIETLEPYRGHGLGASAARTLIRHMRRTGRAPVWGALDTNTASRALAARLGFVETAGIAVFTAA